MPDLRPQILQCVTHLALGGAENVMLSLVEALTDRFRFTVFATMGIADDEIGRSMSQRLEGLGIPVVFGTSLDMKRGGMIASGVALARTMRRGSFDLVHVHTEIPEAALAVARTVSPAVRRTPALRTIHNTELWPSWQSIGTWAERRLNGVPAVAVSPMAAEGLDRIRNKARIRSAERTAASIILNGVAQPPSSGEPDRRKRPARLLFAGRLVEQKGADLLPAILKRASRDFPANVEIDVLGNGPYAEPIRDALLHLGHGWHGELRSAEPNLASRLHEYDALLMPSRFEGLPLLGVEALLAGTPVISTAIDGFGAIISQDDELRVPPGDIDAFVGAIVKFLREPSLHRKRVMLSNAALRERFSLSRMTEEYSALYAELLAANQQGTSIEPGTDGA